ncbi:hypothetical protein IFT93_23615 [Erwinia persicina]|uniref:Uncharacterized protein n=2 Tax=Erwinia persicina TaxID=55211 RepID=A0ABR9A0D3_9GAMM|nr:hypothetical protein [Erwinia persicina]MBD8212510.1 hypothetical protein [Erwinia persicina]
MDELRQQIRALEKKYHDGSPDLVDALAGAFDCITGSLAWHFYRTQKTVTTPMMFDRAFTSTAAEGDAAINSMMVRSLINLRLSVTPETVDGQHAALLRWVPSEDRPEMKKALAAEAEYIKKNGVSTVFRIDDETTDSSLHFVQGIFLHH